MFVTAAALFFSLSTQENLADAIVSTALVSNSGHEPFYEFNVEKLILPTIPIQAQNQYWFMLIGTGHPHSLLYTDDVKMRKLRLGEKQHAITTFVIGKPTDLHITSACILPIEPRLLAYRNDNLYKGVLGVSMLSNIRAIVSYPQQSVYVTDPITRIWSEVEGEWNLEECVEFGKKLTPQQMQAIRVKFENRRLRIEDSKNTDDYLLQHFPDGTYGLAKIVSERDGKIRFSENVYEAVAAMEIKDNQLKICICPDATKQKEVVEEFKSRKSADFKHFTLSRVNPTKVTRPPNLESILLRTNYTKIAADTKHEFQIIVDGVLNGVTGKFLVDTGCSRFAVTDEFAKKAKLALGVEIKKPGYSLIESGHTVIIDSFTIDGKTIHKTSGIIQGNTFNLAEVNASGECYNLPPVDGIIGNKFLDANHAIIDVKERALYLKKTSRNLQALAQGNWRATSAKQNLLPLIVPDGSPQPHITIQDNLFIYTDHKWQYSYEFKYEVFKDHYALYLYPPKTSPPINPKDFSGGAIAKFEGGKLVLCLALDFAKMPFKELPKKFEALSSTDFLLLELERDTGK
jgi:hypothetical protein